MVLSCVVIPNKLERKLASESISVTLSSAQSIDIRRVFLTEVAIGVVCPIPRVFLVILSLGTKPGK